MAESITSADANRNFSKLLRGVREDRASYVVTSHGKAVARIVPVDADGSHADREHAKAALLKRLQAQPVRNIGRFSREGLYVRDADARVARRTP